jgi:hypothetical protein
MNHANRNQKSSWSDKWWRSLRSEHKKNLLNKCCIYISRTTHFKMLVQEAKRCMTTTYSSHSFNSGLSHCKTTLSWRRQHDPAQMMKESHHPSHLNTSGQSRSGTSAADRYGTSRSTYRVLVWWNGTWLLRLANSWAVEDRYCFCSGRLMGLWVMKRRDFLPVAPSRQLQGGCRDSQQTHSNKRRLPWQTHRHFGRTMHDSL